MKFSLLKEYCFNLTSKNTTMKKNNIKLLINMYILDRDCLNAHDEVLLREPKSRRLENKWREKRVFIKERQVLLESSPGLNLIGYYDNIFSRSI